MVHGVPKPVIIKFTQNHEMNDREYNALSAIIEYTRKHCNGRNDYYANLYGSGQVMVLDKSLYSQAKRMAIKKQKMNDHTQQQMFRSQTWSYMIQDELGNTMENHLFEKNEPFSEKTVLQIGIQLLDSFKLIHEAGYTFNDLKLDNVLIGDSVKLPSYNQTLHKIKIIDFGLAKKYTLPNGKHIPMKKEQVFSGNMIFASKNAFNMRTQSRRDDLISLCYFLLYLVDGDLAFLEQNSESSKGENSQDASKQKEEFLRI